MQEKEKRPARRTQPTAAEQRRNHARAHAWELAQIRLQQAIVRGTESQRLCCQAQELRLESVKSRIDRGLNLLGDALKDLRATPPIPEPTASGPIDAELRWLDARPRCD
jgi:hypothetical protein